MHTTYRVLGTAGEGVDQQGDAHQACMYLWILTLSAESLITTNCMNKSHLFDVIRVIHKFQCYKSDAVFECGAKTVRRLRI